MKVDLTASELMAATTAMMVAIHKYKSDYAKSELYRAVSKETHDDVIESMTVALGKLNVALIAALAEE